MKRASRVTDSLSVIYGIKKKEAGMRISFDLNSFFFHFDFYAPAIHPGHLIKFGSVVYSC